MTEEADFQHVEVSAVTPNALEQMERASIDIQIATAKRFPRSLTKFYERATAMVTLDEETAKSCIYHRNVGKDENGKTVWADGESIRMAEIVAASYGNIRVAGFVVEITDKYVKAVGMAHDLESNYAVRTEVIESVVNKKGQPFSDRMKVVVAKAALSKAIRDAIFKVVPKSVCKPLANKAKIVACGDAKTFDARRKAVLEWIKTLKIDASRVWVAIGVNGPDDLQVEDLVVLAGIKTAIDDKDATIEEAFPKPEPEQKQGVEALADRLDKGKKEETKPEQPPAETKKPPKTRTKETTHAKKPKPQTENSEAATEQTDENASEGQQDNTPQTEIPKPKYKCSRCGRDVVELKGGKCPYCFGDCTTLA